MFLTITINGKGGGEIKIQIDVEANDGKPYLIPEPLDSYKFGTKDEFSIFLGYPVDWDDQTEAYIDVKFNDDSSDFMTYNPEILMVYNNEGEQINAGKYSITVTVTGEEKSVIYEIQLDLVAGVLFGDSDPYALDLDEFFEEISEYGDEG